MRENVQAKGRRYLVEGRLHVAHIDAGRIRALCRGQGEVWPLGLDGGRWWCNCPARGTCAHLVALQLVASKEQR